MKEISHDIPSYVDFVECGDAEAIVDVLEEKDRIISLRNKRIRTLNKKLSRLIYHLQSVEMYNMRYIKEICNGKR